MKIIILMTLALCMLSLGATPVSNRGIGGSTGGPKQTWQQIMEDPKVRPAFPPIMIEDQIIDYNFLCLHDDVVRTRYKVRIEGRDETRFDYLYENADGGLINGTCQHNGIPRTLPIFIYEANKEDKIDFDNSSAEILFIKKYSIPECP